MCLCNEFKKRYSSNGLYHGRPVQMTKIANIANPHVMVKKTSMTPTKYRKASK